MVLVQLAILSLGLLTVVDVISGIERVHWLRYLRGFTGVLASFGVAAIAIWLGRKRAPNVVQGVVIATATSLVSLIGVELVFRALLVDSRLPRTEVAFRQSIERKWPHEVSPARTDSVFRIMGLGDSFGTFGAHENWNYHLERILRDRGFRVELVNVSLAAWEPCDELRMLRYAAPRYKPDLVLHGFYVANDFNSPLGSDPVVTSGIVYRMRRGLWSSRPRELAFVQWLRRYAKARENVARLDREGLAAQPMWTYSRDFFRQAGINRRALFLPDIAPGKNDAPTWQTLADIRETCEAQGADYLMVIHPDRFQVEDSLMASQSLDSTVPMDFDLLQRRLRDECARTSTDCLDLLGPFRANGASADRGLYEFRNTHHGKNGNLLAAEVVAGELIEKNYISERFRMPDVGYVVAPAHELPAPAVHPKQ